MRWSEEQENQLRKLWAKGLTTPEIGRRLGVTKNAVIGRAHRLGLPKRPSPIVAAGTTSIERNKTIREMAAQGTVQRAIADTVGISRDTVMRVLKRARNDGWQPPERTEPVRTLPALPSLEAPAPVVRAWVPGRRLPLVALPVEPPPVVRVTVSAHNPCCWPFGEPRTASYHTCDAPAIVGRSYCPTHHKIAYVRTSLRFDDVVTE